VTKSASVKPFNPKQEFEHERLENASLFADSGRPRYQPAGATVVPEYALMQTAIHSFY